MATSKTAAAPGAVEPNADVTNADVTNADVAGFSYEQARDDLVRVVNELEQGSSTLEQSLALWERGEALAQRCEQWLIGARARLDAARAAAANPPASSRDQAGAQ